MAEVQLREIEKRFAEQRILQQLNLTVPSGQYLVLLGESGCGKTTTLKIIAGLDSADQGCVKIDGRDMSHVPPRKRNVAMVFQGDSLYPHLTIEQSLRVGLKGDVADEELKKRIDQAAQLLGITQLLDRKPYGLSGGELRRAAVAKAIVRRSSVRLLDEPLSALDANVRYSIGESLLQWHADYPGTTIHVTHDGQEAMRLADQIAVMDEGSIAQCASPQEIYQAPISRKVALAIGTPLISFLSATMANGRLAFAANEARWNGEPRFGDAKEKLVSVGIRAPACRFVNSGSLPAESGLVINGKVVRTSMIDGRTIVRIAVGAASVDAVSNGRSITPGDDVGVFVTADELHVFDEISGLRLPP